MNINIQWILFYIEKVTFDWRYGVHTSHVVPRLKLNFSDAKAGNHARKYRPSPVLLIKKSISKLKQLEPSIIDSEFIDYGCGAARVVLVASLEGFKSALGIELSPELVKIGNDNIANFNKKGGKGNMDVLLENAATYVPSVQACVFYFFIPFTAEIFKQTLERIEESRSLMKRTMYIIFLVEEYPLKSNWAKVFGNRDYSIWKTND